MRGTVARRLRTQDSTGRYEPWLAEKILRMLGKKKFTALKFRRGLYRSAKRAYSNGSR